MLWLNRFWRDEGGAVVSAEAVVVGTVVVAGATAGLSMVGKAANDELRDVARSIRSLDQSYVIHGFRMTNGRAHTAGSSFLQQPVAESLKALDHEALPATAEEKKPEAAPAKPAETPKKKKKKKPKDDETAFVDEANDFGPAASFEAMESEQDEPSEAVSAEDKLIEPGV
jgi:hypothetical protein